MFKSIKQRIKRCRLCQILLYYPIEPSEFWLGLMSFSFGLWLLNPFFDTFSTVSTYRYITTLLPEPLLGAVMTLLGFVRVKALLDNNIALRRLIGLLGWMVWLFLVIGVIMGNIAATASIVFSIFAAMSFWVYLRLPIVK